MKKTEFFEMYGDLLVQTHVDDAQYGDFIILHPEEIELAQYYETIGCDVVSVHETETGEDDIDITQPCDYGNQPFKIGYFVLNRRVTE
jgi:hypothetical protein